MGSGGGNVDAIKVALGADLNQLRSDLTAAKGDLERALPKSRTVQVHVNVNANQRSVRDLYNSVSNQFNAFQKHGQNTNGPDSIRIAPRMMVDPRIMRDFRRDIERNMMQAGRSGQALHVPIRFNGDVKAFVASMPRVEIPVYGKWAGYSPGGGPPSGSGGAGPHGPGSAPHGPGPSPAATASPPPAPRGAERWTPGGVGAFWARENAQADEQTKRDQTRHDREAKRAQNRDTHARTQAQREYLRTHPGATAAEAAQTPPAAEPAPTQPAATGRPRPNQRARGPRTTAQRETDQFHRDETAAEEAFQRTYGGPLAATPGPGGAVSTARPSGAPAGAPVPGTPAATSVEPRPPTPRQQRQAQRRARATGARIVNSYGPGNPSSLGANVNPAYVEPPGGRITVDNVRGGSVPTELTGEARAEYIGQQRARMTRPEDQMRLRGERVLSGTERVNNDTLRATLEDRAQRLRRTQAAARRASPGDAAARDLLAGGFSELDPDLGAIFQTIEDPKFKGKLSDLGEVTSLGKEAYHTAFHGQTVKSIRKQIGVARGYKKGDINAIDPVLLSVVAALDAQKAYVANRADPFAQIKPSDPSSAIHGKVGPMHGKSAGQSSFRTTVDPANVSAVLERLKLGGRGNGAKTLLKEGYTAEEIRHARAYLPPKEASEKEEQTEGFEDLRLDEESPGVRKFTHVGRRASALPAQGGSGLTGRADPKARKPATYGQFVASSDVDKANAPRTPAPTLHEEVQGSPATASSEVPGGYRVGGEFRSSRPPRPEARAYGRNTGYTPGGSFGAGGFGGSTGFFEFLKGFKATSPGQAPTFGPRYSQRVQKLMAMAGQTTQSPHEASIAREILRRRGIPGFAEGGIWGQFLNVDLANIPGNAIRKALKVEGALPRPGSKARSELDTRFRKGVRTHQEYLQKPPHQRGGTSGGPLWQKNRKILLDRERPKGLRCAFCGQPTIEGDPGPRGTTVDHIIDEASGGTHDLSNLQIADRRHNSYKSGGRSTRPIQPFREVGLRSRDEDLGEHSHEEELDYFRRTQGFAEGGWAWGRKKMRRMAEGGLLGRFRRDVPEVQSLARVGELGSAGESFLRWTSDIKRDRKPGAISAGLGGFSNPEAGISAHRFDPSAPGFGIDNQYDLSGRKLDGRKLRKRQLYLMGGTSVGKGLDGEPVLDPASILPIARVGRKAVKEAMRLGWDRGIGVDQPGQRSWSPKELEEAWSRGSGSGGWDKRADGGKPKSMRDIVGSTQHLRLGPQAKGNPDALAWEDYFGSMAARGGHIRRMAGHDPSYKEIFEPNLEPGAFEQMLLDMYGVGEKYKDWETNARPYPRLNRRLRGFSKNAEGGLLGRMAKAGYKPAEDLLAQKTGEPKERTVPLWRERAQEGKGVAKDLTHYAEGGMRPRSELIKLWNSKSELSDKDHAAWRTKELKNLDHQLFEIANQRFSGRTLEAALSNTAMRHGKSRSEIDEHYKSYLPKTEKRAEGGYVKHTGMLGSQGIANVTEVGERGRELIVQHTNGQTEVVPSHKVESFRAKWEGHKSAYAEGGAGFRTVNTGKGGTRYQSTAPDDRGRFISAGTAAARTAAAGATGAIHVFVDNWPAALTSAAARGAPADAKAAAPGGGAAGAGGSAGAAGGTAGGTRYGPAGAPEPGAGRARRGAVDPYERVLAQEVARASEGREGSRAFQNVETGAGISEEIGRVPARPPATSFAQIFQNAFGGRADILRRARRARVSLARANRAETAFTGLRQTAQELRARERGIVSGAEPFKSDADRDETLADVRAQREVNLRARRKAREVSEARSAVATKDQQNILSPGQQLRSQAAGLGGYIAGGAIFSTAMAATSAAAQAAAVSLGPLVQQLLGWPEAIDKVTSSIRDNIAASGGNVRQAAAVALAPSGVSAAYLDAQGGNISKTGLYRAASTAAGQAQDITRAATAGPRGLYEGIGGLFGTNIGTELFGGQPGALQQITGRIGAARAADQPASTGAARLPPSVPGGGAYDFNSAFQDTGAVRDAFRLGGIDTSGSQTKAVVADLNKQLQSAADYAHDLGGAFKYVTDATDAQTQAMLDSAKAVGPEAEARALELKKKGVTVVGPGNEALVGKQFGQYADQQARASVIEDPTLLLRQTENQRKAQAWASRRQADFTRTEDLPAQFALGNIATPLQRFGTTFQAGGQGLESTAEGRKTLQNVAANTALSAKAEAAISRYSADGTKAMESIVARIDNPTLAGGIEPVRQTIGALGVRSQTGGAGSALTAFRGIVGQIGDIGGQIRSKTEGISLREANLQAKQYNEQLRLSTRSLTDAQDLWAGINGSTKTTVGGLQGQNVLLERQNQLLGRRSQQLSFKSEAIGFRSSELQIQAQNLGFQQSQRQINFNKAIAGFAAPGSTPEERAARIDEAKLEADYAQTQLNLQIQIAEQGREQLKIAKEQAGINRQQFGIGVKQQDNSFTIAKQEAQRAITDIGVQLDQLTQARALTIDASSVEATIAQLQKDQGALIEQANVYVGQGADIRTQVLGETKDLMAATGRGFGELVGNVESAWSRAFQSAYSNFLQPVNAYIQNMGGNTQHTAVTGGAPNARRGYANADGIIGTTAGPTQFMAGEAGREHVLVLRNATEGMMTLAGGGSGTTINVGGISIVVQGTKGMDEAKLADMVTERISRKLAMIGG